MRKLMILLALLCSVAIAQTKPAKASVTAPDKALLQKVLDTWTGPNIDFVAQFYDQSPDNVYYDLTPLKYDGFAQYLSGVKNVVSGFDSFKFTVNDDVKVHRSGTSAWTTCTWSAEGKLKTGNRVAIEGRWTAIWQKKAGKWLILHEQLSVPWTPATGDKREK